MSGGWELIAAVVLGLVINETSDLSPWLAQRLIRWAGRVRYPTRVEELSALIAERPGKLFKLVTACGFACAALTYRVKHCKTVLLHSVTSRLCIGFGSALAAGVLLIGETLLANGRRCWVTDIGAGNGRDGRCQRCLDDPAGEPAAIPGHGSIIDHTGEQSPHPQHDLLGHVDGHITVRRPSRRVSGLRVCVRVLGRGRRTPLASPLRVVAVPGITRENATHRDMTLTITARAVAHPGGRFSPDMG